MAREEIQVRDRQAWMIVHGVAVSTVNIEDLSCLYVVTQESTLFQGDEAFYVALFSGFLWVIPCFTSGVDELIRAVAPGLLARSAVSSAVSPPLPWSWRKKWMGICGLFPIPRLAEHPLATLPDLQDIKPLDSAEIGGEGHGGR